MAQNRNGSGPLVVWRGKGQKVMWGMELWGKRNRGWGRKVSLDREVQ